MSETVKPPSGLSRQEYRRQWNLLNRDRMNAAGKRWRNKHPDRKRSTPEQNRVYRNRRRDGWEQAKNRGQRWTQIEDEAVMQSGIPMRDLADMLGRSVQAVEHRRSRLIRKDLT